MCKTRKMRVIGMQLLVFAIFALINEATCDNIHDTSEEASSKGPRSLQKFVSKSTSVTENRQPSQSPQTSLTTSVDSNASKKTESLDKGMVSPSSLTPPLRQVDSKAPSLLLLKHFRKQVPSPVVRVPKPTVISSEETGTGDDAKTHLPVRFVGPSALITKSTTGKVHNETSSSMHPLHHNNFFSRVTPAGLGLSSFANGGSGPLTQSVAETGYMLNGYSVSTNRGNGESTVSSSAQSSLPVNTGSVLHQAAKDTMYPPSAYGTFFHTGNGASTAASLELSSPQSATKAGLMTNSYGNLFHRGTESSTLPPPGQGFSRPPMTVRPTPQSTTMASHARPNAFENSFRRKQGENTVPNNLLISSPTTLGPLIKTNNKFSSVYSEVDLRKPQTAHPVSSAHKVGVGTAGLTGVLVPGAQERHLLKLLELISQANTGDKIHNYTRNTVPTTVTQAPTIGTSHPLGKVSTSAGLKQDIGTFGFTTPSYPALNSLRTTVAPYKVLKHNQGPTVTPRTPAIHSPTSPSNFLLPQNNFSQRPTITPRTPVIHSPTSPSSILLSHSNPSQRPAINPRTPAMHSPTSLSGMILPQNNLQWLSTMGHLKNQGIFNNLVPVGSSASLLSLLPNRLRNHQPSVDVNRMGTVESSDQDTNERETQNMQSTAETVGLSGNQKNAANSSVPTASSDNGEDLGSLLHLVTAAPVEQGNVLIDMFEQVFSEDEVKNNPVVKQLHDKLEDKIQNLQMGATGDPTFGFLLYFLVPFAIITVLTFTLMGVAPEYVGLTGLLIPLLIMATLTNGGRKSRGRNARDTSGGSSNNNDQSGRDVFLNDAHISVLKSLESFEKSYMGT